jgi:hypothetical protein
MDGEDLPKLSMRKESDAFKRFFEIAISPPEIDDGLHIPRSQAPLTSRAATAQLINGSRALPISAIVSADMAFSTNRFAWAIKIHKLGLVELMQDVMNALLSFQA